MISKNKCLILVFAILIIIILIQVFLIRYKKESSLWLSGTNQIVIQENLSQKDKSFTIVDDNTIRKFKMYLDNIRINYKCGMSYFRHYKITLSNGNQEKVYGYSRRNELADYGNSPGTLTLVVRVYETDSSFESFMMSILNEKEFDFRSLQESRLIKKREKGE